MWVDVGVFPGPVLFLQCLCSVQFCRVLGVTRDVGYVGGCGCFSRTCALFTECLCSVQFCWVLSVNTECGGCGWMWVFFGDLSLSPKYPGTPSHKVKNRRCSACCLYTGVEDFLKNTHIHPHPPHAYFLTCSYLFTFLLSFTFTFLLFYHFR